MLKRILSCFSASLFSLYNLYLFSMMNVLGIYLVRDFNLTPRELGFIGSCDLWGNVLGFIPIGILLDRYNTRTIGIPLLALAIISTFLMSYTNNVYLLSLLRFTQGIASAGSLLITMRLGVSFMKHSNKVIGFMILIALSGGLLGNSSFSFLISHIGWQNSLKVTGLFGIFCLIIMWFWLQNTKNLAKSTRFTLKGLLNKYQIWAGCHIGFLNSPIFILGSLFGNQLLIQQALTIKQSSFISSLLFIGIMVASPFFGFLADKVSSLKIILLGYMGLFLVFAFLIIKPDLPFFAYCVLFLLIGCFCCIQNVIYPLLYQKQCESPSTAIAISSLIFNSLGAMLQIFFGFLLAMAGGSTTYPLLLFPAIFLIGIIYLYQYKA